ncbi:hypothetical protein PIROE2DRAFT_11442 [Piromyces sp. E2]|nr:hypothetical protein PIROE2DRAFT_11442 [Piromyces sp. E2]|eukprot:OUM62294.1 hypothetical protein PIROE2DRAFT_11442 [Piromyces sp. E2]
MKEYSDYYISNNYDIDDKNIAVVKKTNESEAGSEQDVNDYLNLLYYIRNNDMSIHANYDKDDWFNGNNYAMWRVNEPIQFKNLFVNTLCDMKNINFKDSRVTKEVEKIRKKTSFILINENYIRYLIDEIQEEDGPVAHINKNIDIFKYWFINSKIILISQIKKLFDFKLAVEVTINSNSFINGTILVNHFNTITTNKYTDEYFTKNILYVTGKPAADKIKIEEMDFK